MRNRWNLPPLAAYLALLALSLPAGAGDTIAFGPYVQNVTHRSATVCWATVAGTASFERPSGSVEAHPYFNLHYIKLNHLKPDTTYPYDVLGDGSDEGKGAFKTFPGKIRPFRFVAFGDTRSRHDVHARIANRILKEKPLFVINSGDLVSDGLDIPHWLAFFKAGRELMREVPYYPALGNHEHDSAYYFDFFHLPGNERYYTFSVGDALFMILDSEGPLAQTPDYLKKSHREEFWLGQHLPYMEKQKAWAEEQLKLHRDAGYIFVTFHKPVYSARKGRVKDAETHREFWGDLFERNGVQVVFNGHDHHYHHAFNGGTHYIVTGGGGAPLYKPAAVQPETLKTAEIEHFVRVDVGKDEAELTVIDIDGNTIDRISVDRRD